MDMKMAGVLRLDATLPRLTARAWLVPSDVIPDGASNNSCRRSHSPRITEIPS